MLLSEEMMLYSDIELNKHQSSWVIVHVSTNDEVKKTNLATSSVFLNMKQEMQVAKVNLEKVETEKIKMERSLL